MNNTTVSTSLYGRSISGTSSSPFVILYNERDPTPQDVSHPIQKPWLNTLTNSYWILKSFNTSGGVTTANWIKIGGAMQFISTITGNTGGPVSGAPVTNNINLLGGGTNVTVAGNPGAYTLTIDVGSSVATSYVADAGTATPIANVLNVTGIEGVATTGSGDTIQIAGTPALAAATSSIANVGVASFNSADFSVDSNGFVTSVSASSTTYDTNSGTATPLAGVLNILGASGITTSGAGHTVTISGAETFSSAVVQTFTASGTYTPTPGMLYCIIEVLGGGGGGGGTVAAVGNTQAAGLIGAAGGYAKGVFPASLIGASQVVTVGAAGAGGPTGGNNGTTGGTTSVGALISATGGTGGVGFTTVMASYILFGGGAGAGGTGTGGFLQVTGDGGTPAFGIIAATLSTPYASILTGGKGGSSIYGVGGTPLGPGGTDGSGQANGSNASGYGSGGSAGCSASGGGAASGGNGTAGIVIITEFVG